MEWVNSWSITLDKKIIGNQNSLNFSLRGHYDIETSSLICRTNQTGFYIIGTSVMKELKLIFNEKRLLNEKT